MAEFKEVMRQKLRMHKTHFKKGASGNCESCPLLHSRVCGKPNCEWDANDAAELEDVVMKWAAEHPEPKYPTFYEWFSKLGLIQTCQQGAAVSFRFDWDQPIPADVADKLGIKPQ